MKVLLKIALIGVWVSSIYCEKVIYKPVWEDLDARPLPEWYDRDKIGILVHWGLYSVPSYSGNIGGSLAEWFWFAMENPELPGHKEIKEFMKKHYSPGFSYQSFAPMFKAELFNSSVLANTFAKSGARYVVLTSKHHDGFALYRTQRNQNWNSVDKGPLRNIVRELGDAVKAAGLKYGLYYSLVEWNHYLFKEDMKNEYRTSKYPKQEGMADIQQIVEDYKPAVLWLDGQWVPDERYWAVTDMMAWLYNHSPVRDEVVVNDKWAENTLCVHGDFYNCYDNFNMEKLVPHKWEKLIMLDKMSYGYRRAMQLKDVLPIEEVIGTIIKVVSCGGNVLVNIGLTAEGTIPVIFQQRLEQMGRWLNVNNEAIFETSPWIYQRDSLNPYAWYTCKKVHYNAQNPTQAPQNDDKITAIYIFSLVWPGDRLILSDIVSVLRTGSYNMQILGSDFESLNWTVNKDVVDIKMPNLSEVEYEHAFAIKIIRS